MSQPEYDDLATQLTRTLTDRADALSATPLGLAEVTGRARSIRRRRAATAVAGTAAVVALLVPTAALARHSGERPEPGPATQSTTPTETSAPVDARAPLDVRGLPEGKPPANGYLVAGLMHLADGDTATVSSRHRVDAFAVLSDGTEVFHTLTDQGVGSVEVTDSGGTEHGPYPAGFGLAVDDSRTAAAWVSPDGQVRTWVATHTAPTAIAPPLPGGAAQVASMSGDCSAATPCRVLVRTTDQTTGKSTDHVVSSDGTTAPADPAHRFVDVSDVSGFGLVAGYTRIGEGDSCSAVASGSGPVDWKTCDHSLLAFSPDLTSVSADSDFRSGTGSSVLAAYDVATGHLLFEHRSTLKTQAFVTSTVWEDDTHLLATVYQHGRWSVVRFGLDGSMEIAVSAEQGRNFESPIVLAGQP
ncbi:MAG TPA: hypothetical protein VH085_01970 [Nocardioides sp.]|nr:hypothetical protein [Nocardioides sp.]